MSGNTKRGAIPFIDSVGKELNILLPKISDDLDVTVSMLAQAKDGSWSVDGGQRWRGSYLATREAAHRNNHCVGTTEAVLYSCILRITMSRSSQRWLNLENAIVVFDWDFFARNDILNRNLARLPYR
jgi:hypothetical protein